jgi:hypothetical protein
MNKQVKEEILIELNVKNDNSAYNKHNNDSKRNFLFRALDANVNPVNLSVILNTKR